MKTQIKLLFEQSDLGLHCLLRPICPNILDFYGSLKFLCLAITAKWTSKQHGIADPDNSGAV